MSPVAGADPAVSIVVPVYRRPEPVVAAIRSALDQSWSDLEVIVVDDASPEPLALETIGIDDARLRFVARSTNGGVAAAQNTGLAEARGTYVGFLHSDDVWHPDKVARQVAILKTATDAPAVESATERVTRNGRRVAAPRPEAADPDAVMRREVRDLHITGFLFRRDELVAVGGFDEELRAYEDFDLLVRVTRRGPIELDHEVVATLDQAGDDRLAESPWMGIARGRLLDKYEAELFDRYGALPGVWRDWSLRDGLGLIDQGDLPAARRRIQRSMSGAGFAGLRRLPLRVSTRLGRASAKMVAALYERRLAGAAAELR